MRQPGTHNRRRRRCRRAIDGKTRPTRLSLATVATAFLAACGSASAQVGTTAPAPVGADLAPGHRISPRAAADRNVSRARRRGIGGDAPLPTVGISPLGSAATSNTAPRSGSLFERRGRVRHELDGGRRVGRGTCRRPEPRHRCSTAAATRRPAQAACAPMIESAPAQLCRIGFLPDRIGSAGGRRPLRHPDGVDRVGRRGT